LAHPLDYTSQILIMENTRNINNLAELLNQFKKLNNPLLVCLSCREGSNNYLMDQVIFKIQENDDNGIAYYKLNQKASSKIRCSYLTVNRL